MHIKIVGFKCHLDTHFDFNSDSMVLLKGESGAGKSTILQAIYWVLYGSMRGIYNNTGLIKKCSVTLQINQLIIYRQKRPELLKVTIVNPTDNTENTYEDEVAQQIINQAFGSKNLWKSCSYIEQKDRCSLLSGSASDRLALLNQLSFDQDNPKDYISRIDQELKTVNNQFIQTQSSFTAELNMYTQQLTTRAVTVTLTPEEITMLENEINNLTSEIDRLYQEVLNHERNIGSYNMICEQIKTSETKLSNLVITDFDNDTYKSRVDTINNNIQGYRNILNNANHYTAIKQQVANLENQINNGENQLNSILDKIKATEILIKNKKEQLIAKGYDPDEKHITPTSQDVWKTTQEENSRNQYLSECQQLGCDYDQEVINAIIKKLQSQITDSQNMERNLRTYNQLKALKQQISSLGNISTTPDQISELEKTQQKITLEISELRKGLELLQCPECKSSLRYINKALIPGERDPVDPTQIKIKEEEYRNTLNQISTLRSVLSISNQIKSTEAHLEGVDINSLENYQRPNIQQTQGYISRLSRIQIIQPPSYSSDILKHIIEYNNLVQSITNLNQETDTTKIQINNLKQQLSSIQLPNSPGTNIGEIQANITKSELEIKQLHSSYQKHLQIMTIKNQLETTITQLIVQRDTLEKSLTPNSKILHETTQQMLQQSKTKLSEGTYGNSMTERQKTLTTKREKVMSLNEDLTTLQRLKQNAIEVECKQLQDTVDTINSVLCDILPLFFSEPITMVLQLYKLLKTKKQVKPGLNISIKYKGVEYDNINQLSGGEGDRISLALVLSLNSVSNSPVILLDECISSLDGPIKESCVEAMKTLEGKTIICVDHEGVEGFYDNTIKVYH